MHPHACRLRGSNGMHLAHPDSRFALFPLAPPVALFSLGSRNAHKGFLGPAPQHLSGLLSAPPAPFARKTPVLVRCRCVPRR
jgi:hypothetical protein